MSFGIVNSNGSVTLEQATSISTYADVGWPANLWKIEAGYAYPVLIRGGYAAWDGPPVTGGAVTDEESRREATYVDWPFVKVWGIVEDVTRPTLLERGSPEDGDPGTSRYLNTLVRDVSDTEDQTLGSMYFDGRVYQWIKTISRGPLAEKAEGGPDTVTWKVEADRIPDATADGGYLHYFASGVQDPEFAGGYGHYKPDPMRTVPFLDGRSNFVTFYYRARETVDYDYLIGVQLPDGLVHVALLDETRAYNPIRVVTRDAEGNRQYSSVSLVKVDHPTASPIRVQTNRGVYALQQLWKDDVDE